MKRRVFNWLLWTAILAAPWVTQAQNARDYRLDTGVDTSKWVTLSSSATHVTDIEGEDDEASSLINIGFSFEFAGETYTQFTCNSNGRIRLGAAGSNYWMPPFTTLTNAQYNDLPFVTAFGMDNTLEGSDSYVKYELTGTAPNRILVIEYATPSEYDSEGDIVHYQIQFMEDSNRVRLVYGTTDATTYGDYQIGIAAAANDYMMINPSLHTSFNSGTSTTFNAWPGTGRYYQLTPSDPPACPSIIDITLNMVTAGGAVLSWNYLQGATGTPTSYDIEYNAMGSTTAPTTITSSTTDVTLSGLVTNTQYKARIRANCGTDGYGAWDSITFSTAPLPCMLVDTSTVADTIIFSNSTSSYSGVLVYNGWGNTMYQTIYTAEELSAAGIQAGGIAGVDFGFTSNSSYAKEFSIFIGQTDLSSFATNTSYVDPNTLQQVYGPTAHPLSTSGWQHYDFSQPFIWDGTSNIIVCTFMNQPTGTSQSSSGFSGYYTAAHTGASLYRYKDGTQFTLANYATSSGGGLTANRASIHFYMYGCSQNYTCTAPRPHIDSVSTTEINISWIPGYNENVWEVEYREHGTSTWNTAASSTSNTFATITGLTPATYYDIRVMTICGTDTFAAMLTTATGCSPIAHDDLPFTYGFEDLTTTGSNSPLSLCWNRGYLSSGNYSSSNYPYASTTNHTGSRSLYFYGYSTSSSSWLCLPEFEDSINTLQLAFWARKSSTSYSGQIKVGVMTDPADITTYQNVFTVSTDGTTNWNLFELPLTSAPGSGYITILVEAGSSSSNYIYVDDITVTEAPACPHVANLHVDSLGMDYANISWTEMGTATTWVVEYDTADFVPGSGSATFTEVANDSTIILYNLDPATTYYAYVRANCAGDTSTYMGISFTTLASLPATIPYSCDFEGSGSNGWDFVNGAQVNQWYVGSAVNNGGSRSLYISNDGGLTNNYSITDISYSFAVRTFTFTDTGAYAYSFDWRAQGESSYDFIRTALVPASTNIIAGDYCGFNNSNGVPAGGISFDDGRLNQQGSWQTRSGEFTITTPGTYKWVILWRNDGSVGTQPPAAIDNMQIVRNTCPKPTNVVASNIGATEATITWTAGGSETQWVVSDGYSQYDAATTTYTFTSLTPNTDYNFSVRAVCSASDTSLSASVSVATACGPISAFPFIEDFENQNTTTSTTSNDVFVRCWHHINNGTTYYGYPYIASSTTYNHTRNGSKGLYWYGSTTTGTYGDYYYIVLPAIDTDLAAMNTMRVSFWAKASSTSYHPVFDVGVMTDPTDVSTFQLAATHNINPGSSTSWAKFTTELDDFTGYGAYIAIRAMRPSSSWYVYMDDITLDQIPDCPEVSNITASNVTTESADLNWTENGTATSWTIEYGEHGFQRGDGSTETVSTLPYNIMGLMDNTEYDVYVSPDCFGIAGVSLFTFRTECNALDTLPYTMGFEVSDGVDAIGSSTSDIFVECWHHLNNGSDYYGYPYVGGSTYAHTGSRGLYWYNNTTTGTYGDYQTIVLPCIDTDQYAINTLRVSFWAKSTSTSYHPVFQVGVMTDPNDNSTFQLVSSVSISNNTHWEKNSVRFNNFNGNGNYVAIRAIRSTSWYAYVDDITLEVSPDCPEVTDIVVSNTTSTSADLNWTESGDATQWLVEYGVHGFTPGTGTNETTSTRPLSLVGLLPNTEYDAYITPDCFGTTVTESVTFRTECTPSTTIPLTMGFETSDGVSSTGSSTSTTFVDCWHRLNNGSQYFGYPYVGGSTYAHTGSRGLYWFNSSTTGTYGDYQIIVLPAIDITSHPINTLQLSFWAKASSTSYSPYFQVGVMTDPNDANTFVQVGSVNVSNSTVWEEFTTGLAAYNGTGAHVAIRAIRGASWYAYVDDITLENAPLCPAVTNMEIRQTGTTGAVVSWDIQSGFAGTPSSYNVLVSTLSGTPVDTLTSTTTSKLISGLTPHTSYRVRVTPVCGTDGIGTPDSITFLTGSMPCVEFDTTVTDTIQFSNGTETYNGVFVNSGWGNTFCQSIYTAEELQAAGIGGGRIKGVVLGYNSAGSYSKELTIFMGSTNLSAFSTTANMIDPDDMTLVYGPTVRPATTASTGWIYYTFDTPFEWDGASNVVLSTFMNQSGGSQSSSGFYAYCTNSNRTGASIYKYKDSNPFTLTDCLSSGTSGTANTYLPSITFIVDGCSLTGDCARPMVAVDSVGSDFIAVDWAAGNQETSWQVEYREAGGTWIDEGTVYTTGYLFTGLTANQTYNIRVTAQCTDTDMSSTISVLTPCVAQPVPFTSSFENFPSSSISAAMPSCWTRHNNYSSSSGYPYGSTSYAHSGSTSVYMYSTSSSYSYFTLPLLQPSIDSLRVVFWLLKSNTSYAHTVKVGVMTDPDDVTTFTELGSASNTSLTEWQPFEFYLNNYTGDGGYIALMSPNGEYSYPYLDDLTVDYIPACPRVTNVTVSNIGLYNAFVSWNGGESTEFDVVCVPSGTSPDLGTPHHIYSDDTLTLTGLSHTTAYDVYVRRYCYPDTSDWSFPISFRTLCHAIDSLPFFEDFESYRAGSSSSYDFAPCWNRLNNGTTYYGYPYIANSTSYSHSGGTKGLYWYNTTTTGSYGDYQYLILPEIDTTLFSANMLQLSFWAKSSSTSYYPVLEVGVMNNATDTNFTRLRTLNLGNNTTWQYYTIPLSRYNGNGSYIAVRALRNTATWYAYVDEIMLDSLPSCPAPLEVVVDSIGVNELGISWTPSGNEHQWIVTYDSISTVTNDSTLFITGLTPNTPYDISVRAICAPGDTSEASTVSTRTDCIIINTMPWNDDLEGYNTTSSSSSNFNIPCWERFTDATSYYYPYLSSSTSYNHTPGGSKGFYWYVTSTVSYGTYQMVALPLIDTTVLPMNTLQLVFWGKSSSTSYTPTFVIGVMTDDDPTSFTPVDTLVINGNTEWELFEFPLNNYTGYGNRFVLRSAYSMTGSYWYAYIDDFTIEPISPCPRPDSLIAYSATSSSVTLQWHEPENATSWVIEYGPRGFQPGTGTQVTANTNPFVLTGLPSSYIGEYYVRSLCGNGDTAFYNRTPCPFNTAQIPATIPYNYDFESATEWDGWQTNSNTTINWFRGSAVAGAGNYAMYISPDNGTTYGNQNFSSVVNAAAYRDIDFGTIDSSFTITFSAKVGGTVSNTYDGLMVFLVDPASAVEASSSGITSPWGNVNDLYVVTFARLDTTWNTYEASFDTIHGIHRVAFFWFNQNTGASYPFIGGPAAVDNIHIDYSTCPRPVNVRDIALGMTSATIGWDGPATAQYRVVYRQTGADPSTNTYVTTNTNRLVISGLDPETNYSVWVQKICGTDSSLFSDRFDFLTDMCEGQQTALSYNSSMTEGTSTYAPMGYSFYNYGYIQTLVDSAELAGITAPITHMAFNPVNGNQGDYYTNMDIYLANVPESDLSGGFILPDSTHQFVQVTFLADLSYTDGGWFTFELDSTFTWDGHSNLLVAVNRRHGSYQSGASFNVHNTTTLRTRYLYQDGSAYSPTNPTGGTSGTIYCVGDLRFIACGAAPVCQTPNITSVTNDYHSATVTWDGSGTSYEANIKETTASGWPAPDITVSGNSHTFNGLMPSTSYTFRVRQDCNADSLGYSEWIEGTFTTDSLPCLAPDSLHAIDVTNATATLDWTVLGNETNWDIHVWTPGGIDSIYRVSTRPATVGGFIAGLTYNASIRALCGVDLMEGEWSDTVTFATAICPNVANVSAGNVTDNSALITWDLDDMAESWIVEYGYAGFDQGSGTIVPCTSNSFNATGLECETSYDFYVRAVCGTDWTSENWARVSFTTDYCAEPCDAPFGVTATVNLNNVDVSWTPGEGNTAFEVEYGSRGFSHGSGTTVNATEPHATLTGLDYNTQYDLYVRALCGADNYSGWSPVTTFTTGTEGISTADGVSCTIFPNPATSSTTISVGGVNGKVKIEVVDMNGRTVASETLECSSDCTKTIEVSSLAQGAYFVRISGEQVNMVRKLIVK